MKGKKRLLMAAATLASVGAVIALATGVTFGLFSATSTSQSNSFTAGKVTLSSDATANCTVQDMVPGDSSDGYSPTPSLQTNPQVAHCELDWTYGGSVPASLGLDLKVGNQVAGTPVNTYVQDSDLGSSNGSKPGLFDGSATGLQIQVSDGTTQFISGGTNWTEEDGTTTHNLFSAAGNDLYLGEAAPGDSGTITFDWALPRTAGNGYQLAGTTFRMQVHAAQAGNNDNSGCTVGDQCSSIAWS